MRRALPNVARGVLSLAALAAGCGGGGGSDATGSASAATDTATDDTAPSSSASMSASDATATETGTTDPTASTTKTDDTTIGDDTVGDTTVGDDTSGDASSSDDGTTGIGGEANVLYVRDDGQDGNPGTVEEPMRTIQWAFAQAELQGDIDTIRVAEGDYAFDYANDDQIVVLAGVSLHGGYRADWGARDPAQYVTRIVDETPVAIDSTDDDPHRAIEVPAGVGADTVIEGLHVTVARGQFRAAFFVQGDPILRGNVIAPVMDAGSVTTYGVRVDEASPTIYANHFRYDVVQSSGPAMAISATFSDAIIANNVIDLSGVDGNAYAMWLSYGEAQVLGNSIYLPEDTNMYGIWMLAATPTVDNNLIESEALTATCMWSSAAAAVPTAVRNNVLNCNYTLFGTDPLRNWTTVMELEDNLANAEDNLKLAQNIVGPDDDMVLDAQSPCTVTQGGRDITADVPVDIDDVARTVPLSIGAHEWDGGCQ